jgi:competence protein ComEA
MRAILLVVVLTFVLFPFINHAEPQEANLPSSSASSPQAINQIHLNQADAATLMHSIKGIGQKRAEAIVAYREANGAFKSIDDLAFVKGIGKTFVDKNAQQLKETYLLD